MGLRQIMANWNQYPAHGEPMPEPHAVPPRHAQMTVQGVPTVNRTSVVFGAMPGVVPGTIPNPLDPRASDASRDNGRGGMFPWWEVEPQQPSQAATSATSAAGASYHLRTRRSNGSVGLLIDAGAHDNLMGSLTAEQMCDEMGAKFQPKSMNRPLPVEGVGKSAQVAVLNLCVFQ